MVNRLRPRAGKVRWGCILSLLAVAAVVYFAYNVSSVALDYWQFQDAMEQEARFAMRTSNADIAMHLRAKADSLDLPEAARKVQIRRKGNEIFIWADYTVNIELPGFVQEVELRPHVERVF